MRPTGTFRFFTAALFLSLSAAAVSAQTVVGATPNNKPTPVKDSSMLKPPAGAKVAVVEWEDLECPACANAFPLVHTAINHYKIPLVRYDFLIPGHIWSAQAAVFARYLQDKVSPDIATDYRRQVFASQFKINSADDLNAFTKQFMASKGKPMPFVVDPTGDFKKEVEADRDLGAKMGLAHTPTIFVVTQKRWIEVSDTSELYKAIDQAEAEAGQAATATATKPARATTAHK